MMSFGKQTRNPYVVTVVGIALMAIATTYGAIRSMMVRATFRGNFSGPRQFGNGAAFGVVNGLTIVAIILTLVGVVWLGLVLRKSSRTSS
jgi:hypothetical protein